MSSSLREFYGEVIDPLTVMPSDQARAVLEELAYLSADIDDQAKGSDIGRVIVDRLITLGKRPSYSPIFPVKQQQGMLDAFLGKFDVGLLHKLDQSLPVLLSGCTVVVEEVERYSQLTPYERSYINVALPAVRINFVPQEI